MKSAIWFIVFLLSSFSIYTQSAITIGNPNITSGGVDGWVALLVIDEDATYTNNSGVAERISLDGFNFGIANNRGRITPFVVRVNGDNDFTVLSVGRTRISGTDYNAVDSYELDFDNSAPTLILSPGETIAPGFIDANPDGSSFSAGSPIPYTDGGNEVWITGNTSSGSVSVGNPVSLGANVFNGNRVYSFSIDLSILGPAVPTFSTWGLIILGLLILVLSISMIKYNSNIKAFVIEK